MDYRLYLISNEQEVNIKIEEVLKNFEIDFKFKKIRCLNKQYEIDEIRFMDREEYKMKDYQLSLMIDKIRCSSDTFHF